MTVAKVGIEPNSPTGRIRQALMEGGIPPKQLQRREDIWEVAFANYEKYQRLIEGVTRQPLPWSIVDDNILTRHDLYLKQSGEAAITLLKKILVAQGFQTDTPEYEERLAVGLFYFACAPSPLRMHAYRSSIQDIFPGMEELKSLALGDFYQYILDHGGWGISFLNYEKGIQGEFSALESFQKGIGACTEVSKLLFSLFKLAGLKPRLVFLLAQDVLDVLTPLLREKPQVEVWGHMAVGMQWGKRWRYFDPLNGVMSNAPFYKKARPLTLREYYYADLLNQLNAKAKEGEIVEGDPLFQLMEEFGEVAYLGDRKYLVKAELALKRGDKAEAIRLAKLGLQQNPASPELLFLLAKHYGEVKDCKAATPYLKKLFLFPTYQRFSLDGLHDCYHATWRKNTRWLQSFEQAIGRNTNDLTLRFNYGMLLTLHHFYREAEEQFGRLLFYQPENPTHWNSLALLKLLAGQWQEAEAIFALLPTDQVTSFPAYHCWTAKSFWEKQDHSQSAMALQSFASWMTRNVSSGDFPVYAFTIAQRIFQKLPQEMWQNEIIRNGGIEVFIPLANRADVSGDWELLREIAKAGLQLHPNNCFMLRELRLAEKQLGHSAAAGRACRQYQKNCEADVVCP